MPLFLLVAGIIAAGAAMLFYTRKSEASEMPAAAPAAPSLDVIFARMGAKHGVDPLLLKAIAMAESSLRIDAVRNNPPHDVSVGLMQILCIPGEDGVCTNKFNIEPWPVRFEDLKNPELNVDLGAQILAWNLRTFGYPRGIAVYNHWGMRHADVAGPFENQKYVDKVLSNLSKLKGA